MESPTRETSHGPSLVVARFEFLFLCGPRFYRTCFNKYEAVTSN